MQRLCGTKTSHFQYWTAALFLYLWAQKSVAVVPAVSRLFIGTNSTRVIPLFSADRDNGVTQGSLTVASSNELTLLEISPSNFSFTLRGLSSFAIAPSIRQSRCVGLGYQGNVGELAVNPLNYYFPPGAFYNPPSVEVTDFLNNSYIVANTTVKESTQKRFLPLNSTQNNTLVAGNPRENITLASVTAAYRPTAVECSDTAGASPVDPVVLVLQGSDETGSSFNLSDIYFTNATCAKVAATMRVGTRSSSQVFQDARNGTGFVSLYTVAAKNATGIPLNATLVQTALRIETNISVSQTAVVGPLDPGTIYWLSSNLTDYDVSNNTLIVQMAMLNQDQANCSMIADSYLLGLPGSPPGPPTAGPGPGPAQSPVPPASGTSVEGTATQSKSASLSGGTIAGIIVGAVAGAGLLAAALLMLLRRRRSLKQKEDYPDPMDHEAPLKVPLEHGLLVNISDVLQKKQSSRGTSEVASSSDGSILNPVTATTSLGVMAPAFLPEPTDNPGLAPWEEGITSIRLHPSSSATPEFEEVYRDVWKIAPADLSCRCSKDGSPISLGSGGFGSVYWGVYNRQDVAVKVITSHTPKQHERFLREIATLRACTHPHIVQFVGACVQENKTFMAMEFMPRGDLYSKLSAGGNSFRWHGRGRQIALDVASGLAYLHSKDIAHLDLKSPNILLTESLRAKIGDVGLGKMLSAKNKATVTQGGTALWASPEQLLGEQVGTASDMWSFGTLLWEICSRENITGRVLRPLLPEEAPQVVIDLIGRCHTMDPALRPTATEAYDVLASLDQ